MYNDEIAMGLKILIDERATLDSDNWAIVRIAELRERGEKLASAAILWKGNKFEVAVRRADGELELSPQVSAGEVG